MEGINYRFAYALDNGKEWIQVVVWDRPWLKAREITAATRIEAKVSATGGYDYDREEIEKRN